MLSAPEYVVPHLRLFVSVDIQGSTAFKYSKSKLAWWVPTFIRFFSHFPVSVRGEWKRVSQPLAATFDVGPAPMVWKAAGDEILFVKDVTHPAQCATALVAFKSAIDIENGSLEKNSKSRLHLKGAAWIAGFPSMNMEVSIEGYERNTEPESSDAIGEKSAMAIAHAQSQQHLRDFIGPSMDIGFRLASLATPRRFLISADLAFIVCDETVADGDASRQLSLQYEEGQPLKGVLHNRPYPHIWIDMWHGRPAQTALERLLQKNSCNVTDLRRVCSDFIRASKILIAPYIVANQKTVYGAVPKEHMVHLRELRARVKRDVEDEKLRLETERTSRGGKVLSKAILEMIEKSGLRAISRSSRFQSPHEHTGDMQPKPSPSKLRPGLSKKRKRKL